MVYSKPKVTTLFSVVVFLVLAYGVCVYSVMEFMSVKEPSTVTIILIFTTGPIALIITLKTLFGIKYLEISKEKFCLNYPFRFKKVKFSGRDISYWKVDKIKTFGGIYEELVWQTKSGQNCSISRQEHTEFDKARNYMVKKFKKLQRS